MATTQTTIATEYIIVLTNEEGEEIRRHSCMAVAGDDLMAQGNYAADCLIESYGLFPAWTAYSSSTGREMASWLPEGYKRPTSI